MHLLLSAFPEEIISGNAELQDLLEQLKDAIECSNTSSNSALQEEVVNFPALVGQLWALHGEFQQAISAWKKQSDYILSTQLLLFVLKKLIPDGDDDDCYSHSKS